MASVKTAYSKIAAPRRIEEALAAKRDELLPSLLIILLLLTFVSIFHVWSRVKIVELNIYLGETGKQFKELQQDQNRLKLEVASLKTPARIESLAKHELGMALPTTQQVVQVQ